MLCRPRNPWRFRHWPKNIVFSSEKPWWKCRVDWPPLEITCNLLTYAYCCGTAQHASAACTFFSWNQTSFRELLVQFWQLTSRVRLSLSDMWFPLGSLWLLWEIWTGEAGMGQMVSVSVDEGLSCKHGKNSSFYCSWRAHRKSWVAYSVPWMCEWEGRNCAWQEKHCFHKVSVSTHVFVLCLSVLPDLALKPSQDSELLFLPTCRLSRFSFSHHGYFPVTEGGHFIALVS